MTEFIKVYLISPYSHEDECVRVGRYDEAVSATARLIKKGYIVFSPIVHCHPLSLRYNLPGDHKFWEAYNQTFIEWAEVGIVLDISGWQASLGVAAEIRSFNELRKPVCYNSSGLI